MPVEAFNLARREGLGFVSLDSTGAVGRKPLNCWHARKGDPQESCKKGGDKAAVLKSLRAKYCSAKQSENRWRAVAP